MEGSGKYYVLLSIVFSLTEMVYVHSSTWYTLGLNLSAVVVHQVPPIVGLSNQVLTVSPGLPTILEVLI